jgi:Fe-S cluster assembly protein SufD
VQAFIGDAFVALEDEAERERLLDAALAALEGAGL